LKHNEKKFSQILKEKRTEKGLTQEQMALLLDMSARMYSYYEKGDYDESDTVRKAKYIQKLAEIDQSHSVVNESKASYGNIIYVPLTAYGGFLHCYSNKVFLDGLERFTLPGIQGEHFAFEVDGMSMYDKAAPGDKAISTLVENVDWMTKGKMYVLQTVDGLLIKLFDKIVDDKDHFHSYNDGYEGIVIPLKNLKRIYFVDWILKKP